MTQPWSNRPRTFLLETPVSATTTRPTLGAGGSVTTVDLVVVGMPLFIVAAVASAKGEARAERPLPRTPVREEAIHQRFEAGVVAALEEVDHFMDDDIFEAFKWIPDQFEVEPDSTSADVARAPAGPHPLELPLGDVDVHCRFPFRDDRRNQRPQLALIPVAHRPFALFETRTAADRKREPIATSFHGAAAAVVFNDVQFQRLAKKVDASHHSRSARGPPAGRP